MKKEILKLAFFQSNCSQPHFIKMFGEKKGIRYFSAFQQTHGQNLLTFWEKELNDDDAEVFVKYIDNLSIKETLSKRPK
jgi:hypothetical protein